MKIYPLTAGVIGRGSVQACLFYDFTHCFKSD